MPKTFTAPFGQTPQAASAVVTTAVALTPNGVDSGSTVTNSVLLLTAGADGGILVSLSAMARATVTASQLCIWSSIDGGTTRNLVLSELMPAYTLAATTKNTPTAFNLPDGSTKISENAPYRLRAGEILYVGTLVTLATGIVFNARWMDY